MTYYQFLISEKERANVALKTERSELMQMFLKNAIRGFDSKIENLTIEEAEVMYENI